VVGLIVGTAFDLMKSSIEVLLANDSGWRRWLLIPPSAVLRGSRSRPSRRQVRVCLPPSASIALLTSVVLHPVAVRLQTSSRLRTLQLDEHRVVISLFGCHCSTFIIFIAAIAGQFFYAPQQ
jgi:hypothetical protein